MQPEQDYKIVDKYVITQTLLGRGAFGTVYRGYKQDDPTQIVAVKVMPIAIANKNKNFIQLLKRELEILPKIENPHIVKLYNASRTSNNFYMFLEYCNGGDLRELLKKRGGHLSEQEAIIYFKHIVEGFKSIYQENVIHRDIKPANILINDGQAKISDFGFARFVADMEEVDHFTLLGTPLYMSPQILGGEQFSAKCDIWSLGMLFYELLYGVTPWTAKTQDNLSKAIKKNPLKFPAQPIRSQMVKDLLSRMLKEKEEERINWYEIFDHEIVRFQQNQILQQLKDISTSSMDDMDKKAEINQVYLDNNKVLHPGTNAQVQNFFKENNIADQDSLASLESNSLQMKQEETTIQPNLAHDEIIKVQNKQLQKRQIILKIDSYLRYQRNTNFFINYTTTLTFNLFKGGLIKFQFNLFYRLLFILQKYQMINFQQLNDIMATKIPIGNGLNEEDWQSYRQSQEYFTFLANIKTDIAYIKPYYKEIFQRVSEYLQNNNEKLTQQEQKDIHEFQTVLTKEFKLDIAFQKIYEKTLEQVLRIFYDFLQNNQQFKKNRKALQTAKFLKICYNPYKYFKWVDKQQNWQAEQETEEFTKFYEKYETLNLQEFVVDVKNDLREFK